MNDFTNLDIPRLVADIHTAEAARRAGTWDAGDYAAHVTGLYTLRAWVRGRIHRLGPPGPIRDFNRAVRQGLVHGGCAIPWNRLEHNRHVAHEVAGRYRTAG